MRKRVLLLALTSVLMSLCIPVFAQNDYVDLGLSVKWGTVNLGTTNLRPFGWYWTWTDAMNIKTTDGSRLATKAEWNELLDYCTWEWTEKDGKTGYLITSNIDGYRDRSIFLPASGWLQDGNLMRQHSYGSYWTSTPGVQSEEQGAYGFNFMSDGTEWHSENRFSEQSVRMVMPLSESELTGISLEMGNFRMRQASVIRLNVTTADGKRIVNSACKWVSSDENVVSVMDDGLIVARKQGACEITAMAYGKSATCTIHVTPYDIEFVDLGLGVLWATCNLGADKPSDYGDYYAWAEIEPKDYFNWGNYRYCSTVSGSNGVLDKYTSGGKTGFLLKADNLDRLEAIDDVASVLSGGEWYIPTSQDFEELKENCKWNLVKVKGVEGVEFESKVPGYEGKKIFIPYSGCMIDDEVKGLGHEFKLWSSTPSNNLSAYLDIWIDTLSRHRFLSKKFIIPEVSVGYINRFIGMNVRPVKKHDADMFSAISLADEHLDLHYGEIKPMVVSMLPSGRAVNEGNIVWSTSNADVAAVENGYLTAVGTGSCEITASSEGHEAKMTVTVTLPVPEPVDLGLSVKWASANLGASDQNEAGAFFAWGETTPKTGYYSGKNYKFGEYSNQMTKYNMGYDYIFAGNYPMPDYKETLDAEDDAAAVLLGDGWRMPTADELWELRTKCTWTKVQDTLNIDRYGYMTLKFYGYRITSNVPGYEGRSIFLPAAGRMSDYYYPSCVDSEWAPELCYWTSTTDQSLGGTNRFTGCNIRPVKDESGTERVKPEPEPIKPLTHNAQVDLGLSVLWADCNVGAENPWERGARIAWGETTAKTYYSLYNYKHAKAFVDARKWKFSKYTLNVNLDNNSYIDNKTSLDIEDDAAHVNWGGNWRMPTKEECMELFEKCEWKETTLNGVKGYRVTSKVRGYTSNSIFLPCTSVFMLLFDDGNYYDTGCYMTSELGQFTTECVALYFDPVSSGGSDDKRTYYKPRKDKDGDLWSKIRIASVSRIKGAFIRPVCPR